MRLVGFLIVVLIWAGALADEPRNVLNWTDNSSNEIGFEIERDDGDGWRTIAIVEADIETYTDSAVWYGPEFRYRVRAYNDLGRSDPTNIVAKRATYSPEVVEVEIPEPVFPYNAPAPPTILEAR